MSRSRGAGSIVAETCLIGGSLGAVMGLLWWWIAPTEQYIVVEGGLASAEPAYAGWFAADGWFLVLGAIAGVLLAAIAWPRGRRHPVALVAGVIVGTGLVAVVAWSLGGVLGAPDPQTVAETSELGTTVPGALGIRAVAVAFGPLLTSLTVLVLLLASARLDDEDGLGAGPATGEQLPEQVW